MKTYLGADLGGSATKLLLCDPHGKLLAETQCPLIRTSAALTAAVHAFLKTQGRDEEEVESMAMTGVGSSFIEGPVIGKEPLKIDEMQAVGQGAQALSCQQDILAVSMGTGTALIRADHARIRHIGGTGVGGGTLAGLALRLTGMETADFIQLSLSGHSANVDLKVGDLTRDTMQTLNSDLTAANFGKLDARGSAADQAAGLINMILETIGVMAILAVRQDTTRTIVLTGALAVLPQAKPLYDRMSRIYNVNFLIPDHAPYAAALGAVLTIL